MHSGAGSTRSRSVRSAAGRPQAGVCPRSVRERDKISWGEDRRARQHGAGRVVVSAMPAALSDCGCSPIPTSTTAAEGEVESGALLHRRKYYDAQAGAPVSRRHVLRFLPCRAKPDPSARRSRESRLRRSRVPRSARSTCGSTGCSSMTAGASNFFFQLVHTYRPGAMDTSLVSTDNINNPRTMNAIYIARRAARPGACAGARRRWPDGELNNKQFKDYHAGPALTRFYQTPNTVFTPRVLKDGSDSVGALGALNRVYINIGLFSEEWLTHFNAVVGGKPITPIPIATAEKNSGYWQATEAQTPATALFFLQAARPDRLKRCAGRREIPRQRTRPCSIAARRCSPRPARAAIRARHPRRPWVSIRVRLCNGPGYLRCWNSYWAWTKTDDFKQQMRAIVQRAGLPRRQLPVDRVPRAGDAAANQRVQPAGDQCARAATSGITSRRSPTRRCRRSATITVHDPFTGKPWQYTMPAGGRGYTRPPSLISLWSTAPFLLNNTVGTIRAGSVGRRTNARVPGVDRADAVAGEARLAIGPRRHQPG